MSARCLGCGRPVAECYRLPCLVLDVARGIGGVALADWWRAAGYCARVVRGVVVVGGRRKRALVGARRAR